MIDTVRHAPAHSLQVLADSPKRGGFARKAATLFLAKPRLRCNNLKNGDAATTYEVSSSDLHKYHDQRQLPRIVRALCWVLTTTAWQHGPTAAISLHSIMRCLQMCSTKSTLARIVPVSATWTPLLFPEVEQVTRVAAMISVRSVQRMGRRGVNSIESPVAQLVSRMVTCIMTPVSDPETK